MITRAEKVTEKSKDVKALIKAKALEKTRKLKPVKINSTLTVLVPKSTPLKKVFEKYNKRFNL